MSAPLGNATPSDFVLRCTPAGPTATTLPDEILREVFLCFVSDSPPARVLDLGLQELNDWRCFAQKNAYRATWPFILATVCRRWRYMALDTAQLWTWISFGHHPHGTLVCNPEYLEALLNRSKRAALDVYINVPSPVGGEAWDEGGGAICRSLASVCDRWRTLSLAVNERQVSSACAALLSRQTPRLEHFDLRFIKRRNSGPPEARKAPRPAEPLHTGPLSVTLELQKIRTISLSYSPLPVVRITLHSLVSLSLSTAKVQLDTLWQVLHCSPNLHTLRIVETHDVTNAGWTPPTPLRLSYLKELEMLACNSCITSMFSRHIEFPRLETLYTEDVDVDALAALLPSARESLTTLGYGDNGAVDPSLIPVISTLPHVREFTFGPCGTVPNAAFFAAMEAGALFPCLERLYLSCAWFIWDADPDDPAAAWVLEHANETRRSAQALLNFVRSRNSRAATDGAGVVAPPRIDFIQIMGEVDAAFSSELEKLVSILIL